MGNQSLTSRAQSREKYPIGLYLIPTFFALLICVQVLLRPIKFLFADDWLLVDYLIPGRKFSFENLNQLINGHNNLTTKLALVLFSNIFGAQSVTAFAILNITLGLISIILLMRILHDGARNDYIAIVLGSILFFNFKQAQNYNMIISGHFIHSLFCIANYLWFKTSGKIHWRWIPLLIAPFTGGFGLTLVMLELFQSFKNMWVEKKFIQLQNVFFCLMVTMFSYGFNMLAGNSISNDPSTGVHININKIFLQPWYLPSYVLSIFGSQFTPSSSYMASISQVMGLGVVVFLLFSIKKIWKKENHQQVLIIALLSCVLFVIGGYDGTSTSIQNAYSNRYVTSTQLLALVLLFNNIDVREFKFRKHLVFLLVFISLFSGLKSGGEWVNIRYTQSERLVYLCSKSSEESKKKCLDLAYGESFYDSKRSFQEKLNLFVEKR